jgi:hypothetical protein
MGDLALTAGEDIDTDFFVVLLHSILWIRIISIFRFRKIEIKKEK